MVDEEPKYLKKKKSNTSKSKSKSNHKHNYKYVLFICENKPYKGSYCTSCGRIKDIQFFLTEKRGTYYHVLNKDEVYEKFKDLDRIAIENTTQKYIVIEDL